MNRMWKVTSLIIIMEQYVEGLVHHSNTAAGNENIYIYFWWGSSAN